MACTTDNASNNDTFIRSLEVTCSAEGIEFKAEKQHVRCLAHIINLAVQQALKSLEAEGAATDDELISDDNEVVSEVVSEVIPKVSKD